MVAILGDSGTNITSTTIINYHGQDGDSQSHLKNSKLSIAKAGVCSVQFGFNLAVAW